MTQPIADYVVAGGGTVYTLTPTNANARENLELNTDPDNSQWLGGSLAVEHRYIQSLVHTLRAEGWTVDTP